MYKIAILIALLTSLPVLADVKDDRIKELELENLRLRQELLEVRAALKLLQDRLPKTTANNEKAPADADKPRTLHTSTISLLARLPKEQQPPIGADRWNDILLTAAKKWATDNVPGDRIRIKLTCIQIYKTATDTRVGFYEDAKPQKQGRLLLRLSSATAIFSHEEGEKLAQKVIVGKTYSVEGTVKAITLDGINPVGDPKGINTSIQLELSDVNMK